MASEPEEPLISDEPAVGTPATASGTGDELDGDETPALLGAMPAGVDVGTFVHRVLEATDFAAADLDAELAAQLTAVQARRAVDIGDPATVVAGLRAALQTSLGPVLGNRGCVTSPARTGWTSSASSFPWPAAIGPRLADAGADRRCAPRLPALPAIRWRDT